MISGMPTGRAVSSLVIVVVAAAALLLVRAVEASPEPPDSRAASLPDRPGLDLAGSGSNVAITRRLAEAFGGDVRVHESIGSGGGLRALAEGAVDVALVSRGVEEPGLRYVPYARTEVVFASRGGGATTLDELLRIARGEPGRWGPGRPRVPLLREPGDSGVGAIGEVAPELAAALEESARELRYEVLLSDAAMGRALVEVEGAIGTIDRAQITTLDLPVTPLRVEGLRGAEKELAFVVRDPPTSEVARWLAFVASEEGRAIVRAGGYAP